MVYKITEKLNYFLYLLNLSVKYRKLLFNQSYPMRPIFGSKWDNLIYLLSPPPLRTRFSVKEVEEESIPEMARDFIFERPPSWGFFTLSIKRPQIYFICQQLVHSVTYVFLSTEPPLLGAFNRVLLHSVITACTIC